MSHAQQIDVTLNKLSSVENLSNDELTYLLENHECAQESCEICLEYMTRFNPSQLYNLLIDEDPQLEEALIYGSTL